MLKCWKQPFTVFNHQHLIPKRVFPITSHHISSGSCNTAKSLENTQTFKKRILHFFQNSEKYKEMYDFPSNEMIHLPDRFQASEQNQDSNVTELIKDQPVLENASTNITKLPFENKLKLGKSEEKSMVSILHRCTGREALIMANTQYRIIGDNIARGIFYRHLISKAIDWIEKSSTHQELVMWSFLLSLEKSQHSNTCLRYIYERFKTNPDLFQCLNSFETSILCNSWFTSNIIVSSKPMLRVIDLILKKEIESCPGLITQEALCMLKVFRKAGFGSTKLFESLISSLSSPSARNLNLTQATHA